jgi:hypothetical protein
MFPGYIMHRGSSLMNYPVVVQFMDGTLRRGTIKATRADSAAHIFMADGLSALNLETGERISEDGLELSSVKAIIMDAKDMSAPGVRFFDFVSLPSWLWTRITFLNGDVIEGMIANTWSAFCGEMLSIHLSGLDLESVQMLVPRVSIAELQVTATR